MRKKIIRAKINGRKKLGKNRFKILDEINRSARKVQLKVWRRNALHGRWQWRNSYWNWRIFLFLDLMMTFTWVSEIILGHSKLLASHNERFYTTITCRRNALPYTYVLFFTQLLPTTRKCLASTQSKQQDLSWWQITNRIGGNEYCTNRSCSHLKDCGSLRKAEIIRSRTERGT